MKRTLTSIIAIMLALVTGISLAACGGKSSESSSTDPEKIVKQAAEVRLAAEILTSYEIQGAPTYNSYVNKTGDNTYEVTGKATVRDKFGDSYTGKYTVEVKYDPETQKAEVTSVDLETPKKNQS